MSEYLFVDTGTEVLKEGESVITIKDLSPGRKKYRCSLVRAELASNPAKLPKADVLRVIGKLGHSRPKPWAIRIIEKVAAY